MISSAHFFFSLPSLYSSDLSRALLSLAPLMTLNLHVKRHRLLPIPSHLPFWGSHYVVQRRVVKCRKGNCRLVCALFVVIHRRMGRLGKQAHEKVSESAFQKYLVRLFHSCFASCLSYKYKNIECLQWQSAMIELMVSGQNSSVWIGEWWLNTVDFARVAGQNLASQK